jgi:putative ABC transport system ATP-binding protein
MANLLKLSNVYFSPHKSLTITDDVSLEIDSGDFAVIIGGNGSGKSTLIKLINRVYQHTAGSISFCGKAIERYSKKQLAQRVVTLSQFVKDSLFINLTIEENARLLEMSYSSSKSSKKKFDQALSDYLKDFNVKLSRSLNTPLYLLSGGEQQILAFALYLRHQPKLLLLDEHTSALDPKTAARIMELTRDIISQRQVTCLMTTHSLDIALNYGNRLLAIKEGKLIFQADGEKKAALQKADLLDYCY